MNPNVKSADGTPRNIYAGVFCKNVVPWEMFVCNFIKIGTPDAFLWILQNILERLYVEYLDLHMFEKPRLVID